MKVSRWRAVGAALAMVASVLVAVGGGIAPASAVPIGTTFYAAESDTGTATAVRISATALANLTITSADTNTRFTVDTVTAFAGRNATVPIQPGFSLHASDSATGLVAFETSTATMQIVLTGVDTSSVPAISTNSGASWTAISVGTIGNVAADSAKYETTTTSIKIYTKRFGQFGLLSTTPSMVLLPSPLTTFFIADTGTATFALTRVGSETVTYSSADTNVCTVTGTGNAAVATGVAQASPAGDFSLCEVRAARAATSTQIAETATFTIPVLHKIEYPQLASAPLSVQLPVNYDTNTQTVESVTITMEANTLETDTIFTLTPLAARTSGLPAFSITAVESATVSDSVTTFLKPVKIELPAKDTSTAVPAFRTSSAVPWSVIVPGDSVTVMSMADTATATTYETTTTGFVIWTRHMTSFGVQDEQAALNALSSPTSLTVGSGNGTLSTSGGSGSGAVTYASSTTSICTVSGNEVTPVAEGSCSITATKAGDDVYAPKTSAAISISVAAAATSGGSGTGGGGGGVPPIVASGSGTITGTATYDAGGTVKCEAPTYSQTPSSVTFTWSGIATGTLTVSAAPWVASIAIPAKTDGTLVCNIVATGAGSTASSQVSFKIDKPAPAPTPTPSVTPTPEPTPTVTPKPQYKIKCVKWNKKVKGAAIRYKAGTNPKCFAGYKQTAKTRVRS